jgi:hypothetical protein
MLGIFVVAFYIRWVQAKAVFLAAIVAQGLVIALFFTADISYLWLNPIGVGLVIGVAGLVQATSKTDTESPR